MSTVNIKCSGTVYEFRAAPVAFTGLRANSIKSGMYGAVFGLAPDGKRYPVECAGHKWLFAAPGVVLESGERGMNRRRLDENGRDMFMAIACVWCFIGIGVLLAL